MLFAKQQKQNFTCVEIYHESEKLPHKILKINIDYRNYQLYID